MEKPMLQVITILSLALVAFASFFISRKRSANQGSRVTLFKTVSLVAAVLTIILGLSVII